MFHPHDGRIVEATEDNVKKANAGEILAEFPWLCNNGEFGVSNPAIESDENDMRETHPVTCIKDK